MALEDHADGYHGSPGAQDSSAAFPYDDVEVVAPRRSLRSTNLRVNGSPRQHSLRQLRAQQRSRAPPPSDAASSSRVSASRERFQPRSSAQSVPRRVSLRTGSRAQSSAAAFRALSNAETGPERITSTRNSNRSIARDARLGTSRSQVGRSTDDSVMCLESDEEVVERRPNPAFLRRVSSAVEAEHAAYSPDSMRFLDQLLDHPTPGQRLFSSDVGFAGRIRYPSDASTSLSSSSSQSSTSVSRKRKRPMSGVPPASTQAETTRSSEVIDLTESPAAPAISTALPVRSTRSQGVSSFGTRLAAAQRVRDSVATSSYSRDNILHASESVHAEDDMSRAFFLSNDPAFRQSTRERRRNRQPLQSRLPVHGQFAARPPVRLNGSTRRSTDTSTSSTQQRDNADVPMSDEEFARMLQEMEFSVYQPPGTPLGYSPLSTRPLPRRQAIVGVGTDSLSHGHWEDGYIDEFIPELSGLVFTAVPGMVRKLLLSFCFRPPFMGLDPRNYMLDNSIEMDYEQLLQISERIGEARPRGLNRRVFETFPSKTFVVGSMLPGEGSTCSICLGDYEVGEKLKSTPCSHCFHTEVSRDMQLCFF
ncbi:hypothetical protein BC832DRAFT_384633 [Gaertneriomyces semiglobifer]|nr:hypothetical protein BC832DRAFT_384633 [Gaertneriomyces semiglobifer]